MYCPFCQAEDTKVLIQGLLLMDLKQEEEGL